MEDVKVKTRTGAFLTLLSAAFIFTFMTIEFLDYRKVGVDTSIVVDKSMGEKVTAHMNITFPRVPCFRMSNNGHRMVSYLKLTHITFSVVSMDVMDISGDVQRDLSHSIIKTRIDSTGQMIPGIHSAELESDFAKVNKPHSDGYCGSCYGAAPPEGGCCNTCDSVRDAYTAQGWSFGNPEEIEQCVKEGWKDKLLEQSSEGCNVAGRVRVNKVIGNIHFSPGRSFQAGGRKLYDLVPYLESDGRRHDFTHHIHYFRFEGDDEYNPENTPVAEAMRKKLSIDRNPLDGQIGYVSVSTVN
jgi:endoplasmic reticulum-Golgi intermediate compartment protein 3